MKQHLLHNCLTLHSKKPDMVRQELWGVLLAYNLLRFQMAHDGLFAQGHRTERTELYRAAAFLVKQLTLLLVVSPCRIPEVLKYITDMAPAFVLPHRRERAYPRAVKENRRSISF